MERWMPKDQTRIIMSMFAPILFPPSGVLAFVKNANGEMQLAATGSVFSCNPGNSNFFNFRIPWNLRFDRNFLDRICLKRVVLSGAPFKINKKHAVVRFMFHNPEDIAWFKPLELRTKYGRRGHIKGQEYKYEVWLIIFINIIF